jgi:hypothetical protein
VSTTYAQDSSRIRLVKTKTFGTGTDELFQLADMTTDSNGHLYVTDMADNRIKKFSSGGNLIWQAGVRSRSNGSLEAIRLIRHTHGRLYITDQYRSGIQVFDTDGIYLHSIPHGPPIIDLFLESKNRLWVEPLLHDKGGFLACIDSSGTLIEKREIGFLNRSTLPVFSFIRTGGFTVLACKFIDRILCCNSDGEKIWETTCDLPVKQTATKIFGWRIPGKTVFKDISRDTAGRIFVLGGHFSEHNSRDIYILGNQGELIGSVTLEEPTHCIHIDTDNYLYVRSKLGSQIIKYRITFME